MESRFVALASAKGVALESGFGGLDLKDRVVELEDGPVQKSAMVNRLVNHLSDNLFDQ